MSIELLEFGDPFLCELSVCAQVCSAGDDSIAARFEPRDHRLHLDYPTVHGMASMRFVIESLSEGHWHLHVDVVRERERPFEGFTLVQREEIDRLFGRLIGLEVDTVVSARFALPLQDVPRRGIIETLYGTSTEACGNEMRLTGAQFQVEGDLFTEVRWHVTEDENLGATLEAGTSSAVSEQYLNQFAELMRAGLDCYVLESRDRIGHAEQAKPVVPLHKNADMA